jgi:hypothetical protein
MSFEKAKASNLGHVSSLVRTNILLSLDISKPSLSFPSGSINNKNKLDAKKQVFTIAMRLNHD